ncbi:MAG: hypothetical protein KKC51_06725 [Verrucomicrobia bacterium]|nr:hypothetical protein [Verrucomicrobiota bacterium]
MQFRIRKASAGTETAEAPDPIVSPRIRRLVAALGLLLLLVGMWRTGAVLVRLHGGVIWGDSFTYVTFARQLAGGSLFSLDGPVAEMVASAERPDRRYWEPMWNHAVRPDGRAVCSMAIGYPLLLALALRLGGIWLLYHLNLLLTMAFLIMLALIIWEGLGRNLYAGLTAIAVALLAPFIVPEAVRQFTYPWREPYFYILLFGAVWALLRFQRSGRGTWLGLMALLSGIACSVKEVNVVYVAWFGVMVLSLPGYRRHPRIVRLTLACAALFFIGLSPLLVQNAVGTGNPFISLQLLRETREYSLTAPGAGLSMGNVGSTFSRYRAMYAWNPFYAPWVMALAALGALMALRHLLGRTLLGLAVVHFILYTQWGNADLRQSYFFNLPYIFFIVHGPFGLAEWLTRGGAGRARRLLYAGQLAAIAVIALTPHPPRWRIFAREMSFRYRDGAQLAHEIDTHVPKDALLLVNRSVREVLGTFSARHIVRLSDLYNLRTDRDVHPLLEPLVRTGQLYFLDNVDRDPHYLFRGDRARIDQETLLSRYRLVPVAEWPRNAFPFGLLVNKPKLTLYRVLPWEAGPDRRELNTPPGGAAFLFVNRRSAVSNLVVKLDGQVVPLPEDGGYFCPMADRTLGPTAMVEWESLDGAPVPPLDDLALIGWHDSIDVDFGLDSIPQDGPHIPDGLIGPQGHAPWRSFNGPFRLRLPVFARPGVFCAYVVIAPGKEDNLVITGPFQRSPRVLLGTGTAWFNVPESVLGAEDHEVATNIIFGFRALLQPGLRVKGVRSYPCRRTLAVTPSPESRGLAWRGRIAADHPGQEDQPWSMNRGGIVLKSGMATHRPFSPLNQFRHLQELAPGETNLLFEFHGGGVTDVREVEVGETLELRMDKRTRYFLAEGSFGPERDENGDYFCWSKDVLQIAVPMTPGAKAYRLRVDVRDGHPRERRMLEIVFGDAVTRIPLERERREYEWTAPAIPKDWGLATLEFRISTWRPNEVVGSRDERALGFQFYGLDWRPVK